MTAQAFVTSKQAANDAFLLGAEFVVSPEAAQRVEQVGLV